MGGLAYQAILGCTSVLFFAYAAKQEQEPQWLWAGLSLGLWILCWVVLGGGVFLTLLGQVALYGAMWVFLILRARRREGTGIRR